MLKQKASGGAPNASEQHAAALCRISQIYGRQGYRWKQCPLQLDLGQGLFDRLQLCTEAVDIDVVPQVLDGGLLIPLHLLHQPLHLQDSMLNVMSGGGGRGRGGGGGLSKCCASKWANKLPRDAVAGGR